MGRNVIISVLLHAVIFIVAYVGLPSFTDIPELVDVPISVEIVTVSDKTNIVTKPKESSAKPDVKPTPKPPAPPPAPQGAVEQPPEPAPVPETSEEKVALLPQPETKPKDEAKPKPEPKPEEPKKTETKKLSPAPVPPRKPKASDQFEAVLKTLEDLKSAPTPDKTKEDKPVEPDFDKMMADALESDKPRTDVGAEMTISEIDLVRQQIHRCWNLPAGAKDAHEMLISIRITMNPDGTVSTARVLDNARMATDPFYRTMAESALRAVLNPRCQPFKLPPEKYERWQNMKLNFNPRDMFGL
ncbi:MAG: energy transducer TonB [Rhodospirillales bacterium]|nr:energy transducer TonB [Rhodospirillales bacterium]